MLGCFINGGNTNAESVLSLSCSFQFVHYPPSGVPMKQIREWLGHSDFSTTANIYTHPDSI
ncbi:MAG: hypothetical protein MRZ14_01260 [Clostridiales bacterium]|nr:hypothetical protein [Clostridiales bacterium]